MPSPFIIYDQIKEINVYPSRYSYLIVHCTKVYQGPLFVLVDRCGRLDICLLLGRNVLYNLDNSGRFHMQFKWCSSVVFPFSLCSNRIVTARVIPHHFVHRSWIFANLSCFWLPCPFIALDPSRILGTYSIPFSIVLWTVSVFVSDISLPWLTLNWCWQFQIIIWWGIDLLSIYKLR